MKQLGVEWSGLSDEVKEPYKEKERMDNFRRQMGL